MKVLTTSPYYNDHDRIMITFIYGDLILVMPKADMEEDGPYGSIWDVMDDATRGGYEDSFSNRLRILGMPDNEIKKIIDDIKLAFLSKKPFNITY